MKELSISISVDELEAAIADTLQEYNTDLKEKIEKAAKQAAGEAVKELKQTSPQGPNHMDYKSGWKSRKDEKGYIVHNAKKPSLTYLLENGHAVANQHGHYSGRVDARPHIKPAEEHAIARFTELMEGDDI
ncbi:hypothetical protein BHK98_03895 [Hornefia porci]|uniref:HK97 gp10 family phage protein n=1 Tax=Hornefia porci TaxID=2652292 RepID=A0A1Q9JGB8_9FIRM|nr:HK97 gp10 family phage protein [Hornefia porci]OLR55282.1 hypothetical protein BHK98_03895 [Hornefia porci]